MIKLIIALALFIFTVNYNCQSRWEQCFNNFGGMVLTSAIKENKIFIGTVYGGVYLSTDDGLSWAPKSMGLVNKTVNNIIVYDSLIIINVEYDGIYVSNDGADSWIKKNITDNNNNRIIKILINEDQLLAGTDNDGLFKSTDFGDTWVHDTNFMKMHIENLYAKGELMYCLTWGDVYSSSDHGNTWIKLNKIHDERISTVFADESGIFAGTDDGKIYLSTDKGLSWINRSNGLPENHIYSMVYNINSFDDRLYAGLNDGVYVSSDAGRNWVEMDNGITEEDVVSLAVDGDLVCAGARRGTGIYVSQNNAENWDLKINEYASYTSMLIDSHYIFAGTDIGFIYFSSDSGNSWAIKAVSNPYISTTINAMVMLPGDKLLVALQGCGLFLTEDHASSFSEKNMGLTNLNVKTLAYHAGYIYAGTQAGVFISTNQGETWSQSNIGLDQKSVISIACENGYVYAGTQTGLFISNDSGLSWHESPSDILKAKINTIAIDNGRVYFGTPSGIYISTDHGADCQKKSDGLINLNVHSIIINNNSAYAATGKGVFISTDNGDSWHQKNNGLMNDAIFTVNSIGKHLIAGSINGVYVSADKGNYWNKGVDGLVTADFRVLASFDNDIYCLDQQLFRTTDNGLSWSNLYDDYLESKSIVVRGDNIFVGSSHGVMLSTDKGLTWADRSKDLFGGNHQAIAVSGNNVIVGSIGYGPFFSPDFGETWTVRDSGLQNDWAHSILIDGNDVFMGTDLGLYYTTLDGNQWVEMNNGLGDDYWKVVKQVFKNNDELFIICSNRLYASTDKGKFWSLKNLELSEITSVIGFDDNIIVSNMMSGVWISTDCGSSWRKCNDGLTMLDVMSLAKNDEYIFASTMGNGIFKIKISELIDTKAGEIVAANESCLHLYPNPANELITIYNLPVRTSPVLIEINSVFGQIVNRLEDQETGREIKIDISALSQGLYFCRIIGNDFDRVMPFVVLR